MRCIYADVRQYPSVMAACWKNGDICSRKNKNEQSKPRKFNSSPRPGDICPWSNLEHLPVDERLRAVKKHSSEQNVIAQRLIFHSSGLLCEDFHFRAIKQTQMRHSLTYSKGIELWNWCECCIRELMRNVWIHIKICDLWTQSAIWISRCVNMDLRSKKLKQKSPFGLNVILKEGKNEFLFVIFSWECK